MNALLIRCLYFSLQARAISFYLWGAKVCHHCVLLKEEKEDRTEIWQEKRIGLNLLHFQAKNLFAMKWIFLKMLLLLDAHFQSQKWHPIKWGKERIFDWIDQSITLSYLRFFVHFLKRGICNILLCQKLSNCNPWFFFVKLPRPFTRKSSFNNFFMTS